MAEHAVVSPATVQRIWDARGLKPHRVETFKSSSDPQFEDKLIDDVVSTSARRTRQHARLIPSECAKAQAGRFPLARAFWWVERVAGIEPA